MKLATPRMPFRNLSPSQWTNLVMAALATLFAVYVSWVIIQVGPFDALGMDYRAFRASGEIAASRGFAEVYDLSLQEAAQLALYETYSRGTQRLPYVTLPVLFLPPFIAPFVLLSYLEPGAGFAVWTLLSAAALGLYLRRFRSAIGCQMDARLSVAVLLAFPTFTNLFFGQISTWLVICIGEAFLATLQAREFRSGLWLAGLLIKPQILILILPALLIGRRFSAFSGFGIGAAAIILVSVQLAGIGGMVDLIGLLTLHAAGPASAAPELMVNWRSLAVNLEAVMPPALAWGLAMAGLLVTAGVALALWMAPIGSSPTRVALVWTATFAATCAVTWHSHQHMAMPVILLLLYLALKGHFPSRYLLTWLLLPGVIWLAGLLLMYAMVAWFGSPYPGLSMRLAGLSILVLNMWVVLWVRRVLAAPAFADSVRKS